MSKKLLYCDECDLEFRVNFGMSDSHYHASIVSSGNEINSDNEDELDEGYRSTIMSKCSKCGHECHCGTDCEECVNDVCHDCNCYGK